jgi:hypothetical protein
MAKELPSQDQMNGFMSKLRTFRDSLSQEEQPILDTMVAASFSHDEKPAEGDVQGYWYVRYGVPYTYPVYYTAPVVYPAAPFVTYWNYYPY